MEHYINTSLIQDIKLDKDTSNYAEIHFIGSNTLTLRNCHKNNTFFFWKKGKIIEWIVINFLNNNL